MSGILSPQKVEYKITWDIFFFRVNGKNKVDSIRVIACFLINELFG